MISLVSFTSLARPCHHQESAWAHRRELYRSGVGPPPPRISPLGFIPAPPCTARNAPAAHQHQQNTNMLSEWALRSLSGSRCTGGSSQLITPTNSCSQNMTAVHHLTVHQNRTHFLPEIKPSSLTYFPMSRTVLPPLHLER